MTTYVVGDIQGCFLTLKKLLFEINFNPQHDRLILLGDVINRGPDSLALLRFVKEHSSCIRMVLGNHEIFAIAKALDAVKINRSHTLEDLFTASDKNELINFLRKQPLIIEEDGRIFVHAGIMPSRSIEHAIKDAHDISSILNGPDAKNFLQRFYEKIPTVDKPDLKPKKSLRLALAYLTLLRMCDAKISMDLSYSGTLDKAPKRLKPWFDLRHDGDTKIYFGHWAALGFYQKGNYYCLDSGCVWGNQLTALRLTDQKVFQVDNCETSRA